MSILFLIDWKNMVDNKIEIFFVHFVRLKFFYQSGAAALSIYLRFLVIIYQQQTATNWLYQIFLPSREQITVI